MIGGQDIVIPTKGASRDLDCAVRVVRLFWPHAVFENGQTAELHTRYDQLSYAHLTEVLIYKDLASFKKWEQLGADPVLEGTMIHLLSSPDELTLVIDSQPEPGILKIVASIRHALRMNSSHHAPWQEAA